MGHLKVEGPDGANELHPHGRLSPAPCGSPGMFHVEEVLANGLIIGLLTYFLIGKVLWCGCEFIAFTAYNIVINFDNIFPIHEGMHTLPYIFAKDEE
ncbi:hypothetical protein D1007_00483 [Hordeum vulgare]|nr:hypothetical protein D1007_00483 [Hordeum vulgare]